MCYKCPVSQTSFRFTVWSALLGIPRIQYLSYWDPYARLSKWHNGKICNYDLNVCLQTWIQNVKKLMLVLAVKGDIYRDFGKIIEQKKIRRSSVTKIVFPKTNRKCTDWIQIYINWTIDVKRTPYTHITYPEDKNSAVWIDGLKFGKKKFNMMHNTVPNRKSTFSIITQRT